MITQLKPDGITHDLLAMGSLFFREAKLPGVFNAEYFQKTWSCLIANGCGNIWTVSKDDQIIGAIGGLQHPDICTGDLVVQEAFWFMHPSQRGGMSALRLYHALADWAMYLNARRLCMSTTFAPGCEKLRQLYHNLGFEAVDVFYFKTL